MISRFQSSDFEPVHSLFLQITEGMLGEKLALPLGIEALRGDAPAENGAAVAAAWLWLLDASIGPQHFRSAIERLDPGDDRLQAVVRYFACKATLGEADIERLEWLVTYIFRRGAKSGAHIASSQMLRDIDNWLGRPSVPLSGTAEALLTELVEILEEVVGCNTLLDLTQVSLIDRGRRVKQKFKQEFAHPQVLAAVVNYNLVSKRKFDTLLSAALTGENLPADFPEKEYHSASEDLRQWSEAAAEASRPAAAPENLTQVINLLGIDPAIEEGRLNTVLNEVISFARAAGQPIMAVPLPHASLALSHWELQSLVVEYPGVEKSFRAEVNRALRRAVAVLAGIEEESALHDVKRHSEHHWKRHVDTLIYLLHIGRRLLEVLEKLAQDAGGRGLKEKADQLIRTAADLRQKLDGVNAFYQEWKQKTAEAKGL